jgi:hypothetical protein
LAPRPRLQPQRWRGAVALLFGSAYNLDVDAAYWQAGAVGFGAQQLWRAVSCVAQAASRAVVSALPAELHFSFDFPQFIMLWYSFPQGPAKELLQAVISNAEGAVSFAQRPLSEHEASPPPQPVSDIAAMVIAAKSSFFISCPSKFDVARCGSVLESGLAQVVPQREDVLPAQPSGMLMPDSPRSTAPCGRLRASSWQSSPSSSFQGVQGSDLPICCTGA